MSVPNLYYVLTTQEAAKDYTERTILFSSQERPLEIFDDYNKARHHLEKNSDQSGCSALLMKFELQEHEMPEQLSLEYLTQIGTYQKAYSEDQKRPYTRYHAPQLDDTLMQRVSPVTYDDIRTEIADKLNFIKNLAGYRKKMQRYMESQTEVLDGSGMIDSEMFLLLNDRFEELLRDTPDSIIAEYGLTKAEYDLMHDTRRVYNELGSFFSKAAGKNPEYSDMASLISQMTAMTGFFAGDIPGSMTISIPFDPETDMTAGNMDMPDGTGLSALINTLMLSGISEILENAIGNGEIRIEGDEEELKNLLDALRNRGVL